jgi:sec-independent protein translocase protein TatC
MAILDFLNRRNRSAAAEMSFLDHLEELRWHIIRAVIAVLVAAIGVFIYVKEIVDKILLAPAHDNFVTYKWLCAAGHFFWLGNSLCLAGTKVSFISTEMTGQFISSFTIAFMGGFVVAFPYVFWEFWRFVRPALKPKELKKTRGVIFWVSFLFFLGVAFGYYVLTPFMVNFYFSYSLSSLIEIKPTFSDYLENLIWTTVGIGVLFQMPLLMAVLTRIGIISSRFLKKYRRHAFVVIITAAAIITPSTDPFSLTLVTIPLYALYEASIILATRIDKAKKQEQTEEWS